MRVEAGEGLQQRKREKKGQERREHCGVGRGVLAAGAVNFHIGLLSLLILSAVRLHGELVSFLSTRMRSDFLNYRSPTTQLRLPN
jgi:hypothetical protein